MLWQKNLSTSVETQVIPHPLTHYAVSHDGAKLIRSMSRGNSWGLAIVCMNTGKELRWLASNAYRPVWSPNDQESAFLRDGNIWIRNTDDLSDLRQITNFTCDDRIMGHLGWGSNGLIAFGIDGEIFTIKPDGTELTCIYEGADAWAEYPSWSPSGNQLAFALTTLHTQGLFVINSDGTGLTQVTRTVAAPVFQPDGGEYDESQAVTISSATPAATIRYTTDGSDPTETSPKYTRPVKIGKTTTLKAKAWKKDHFPSVTATAEYVIQVKTPEFGPDGGSAAKEDLGKTVQVESRKSD